jgi:hypothetical protein
VAEGRKDKTGDQYGVTLARRSALDFADVGCAQAVGLRLTVTWDSPKQTSFERRVTSRVVPATDWAA